MPSTGAAGQDSEAAERFLVSTGLPAEALERMKGGPYWPRMRTFARTLPYGVTLAAAGLPAGLDRVAFPGQTHAVAHDVLVPVLAEFLLGAG